MSKDWRVCQYRRIPGSKRIEEALVVMGNTEYECRDLFYVQLLDFTPKELQSHRYHLEYYIIDKWVKQKDFHASELINRRKKLDKQVKQSA